MMLSFDVLRSASLARLPLFKRRDGGWAHTKVDGSDWSPASWLQAVVGELGEYANLRKKVERGDYTLDQVKHKLASELADIVIYLDLLAAQLGINLGQAVIDTWNEKALQLDIPMRLEGDGWAYVEGNGWHYTRELTVEERSRIGSNGEPSFVDGSGV